jgi:hypothetical protein
VLAFTIMWQMQVLQSYYYLFNIKPEGLDTIKIPYATVIATTAGLTLLSSGIVLTYLRLKEPLF